MHPDRLSPCSRNARPQKDGEGAARCPSCSQNAEGMETDDLLCSRNARPQKALVGRAQWKINQLPSLERERASLEGAFGWMTVARYAVKGSLGYSSRGIEN